LGEPKQLLPWKQGTLIENVVGSALALPCEPVIVVLGAEHKPIRSVLPPNIKVVVNPHWSEGVGSSIRKGVGILNKLHPESRGVLFLSCDQPLIERKQLIKMLMVFEKSDKSILAAAYADTVGIPAIFARNWFPKLCGLKGDQGAKILLKHHPDELATLPLPEARWDIDDWETYHRLKSMSVGEDVI